MKGLKVVFCLVVLLFCSTYSWAEWYPGIIHAHSTFSDGARNPEELISQAKQAGARFLIVTDHYEQIDGLYQSDGQLKLGAKFAVDKAPVTGGGYTAEWVLKLGFQNYGFDKYRSHFLAQTSSDFVVIPGAEITTFWGIDAKSHLLAIGDMGHSDKEILGLQMNKDKETQQELIKYLKSKGILTVAAHPNLVTLAQYPRVWEVGNFQFDPANTKELHGIEFFNDGSEGYPRTLRFYLLQQRSGDQVFVISGCDSHFFPKINPDSREYFDPNDPNRWTRKTWVFSEKLEAKSLLEAMAQGHTYAAQYGASLENLNYIPGFQVQEVERPRFLFFVAFDKKITSSKTIRIYRDGNLVESSVQTHKKENIEGLQKIAYTWEDKAVKDGEHSYVIEVEGVLITSPIRLRVKKQPPPIADTVVIEGKYFFQEDTNRYLELRKDGTCSWWYTDRPWEGDPRFPPPQAPQEGRWSRDKNTLHLFFENPGYSSYDMLLIKGNGVIVRIISGSAWVKKGARYSFSQKEVSGTYKYDGKVLILRPEGTCTYTDKDWRDKKSANGRWKIEGNLILPELDEPFPKDRVLILRVLDRDTLIQQGQWSQMRWVRQK